MEKKKTASNGEQEKSLQDIINEIKNEYDFDMPKLPDAPKYDKIEYEGMTDEEIAKKAEETLADYYNKGVTGVDSEIESLKSKYENDKKLDAQKYEKTLKETESAFDNAKKNIENDTLKRGLARSSIAVNKVANVDTAKADNSAAIKKEYNDSVAELTKAIDGLSAKREKALNDFNIAYAVKLTEQMNGLSAERETKKLEALKYNNTISEKENQAQVDKIMKESDLYSEYLNQRKDENDLGGNIKDKAYQKIYEKLEESLKNMTAKEAREAIRGDKVYSDNLNDFYYYKLYDVYGR